LSKKSIKEHNQQTMLLDEGQDVLHRFDKVLPIEPIIDLVITDLVSKVMPTIAELQTELDDARRESAT